jgi:hypothetical protein
MSKTHYLRAAWFISSAHTTYPSGEADLPINPDVRRVIKHPPNRRPRATQKITPRENPILLPIVTEVKTLCKGLDDFFWKANKSLDFLHEC